MSMTRKQAELLAFITDRIMADDIAPSFEEMKDAVGLKSKSGVHRLITELQRRGYIKRDANRARCIKLVKQIHIGLDGYTTEALRAEVARRDRILTAA